MSLNQQGKTVAGGNVSREGRWYRKDGFGSAELSPLEVDVILLAFLRGMRILLSDRRIARDFAPGRFPTLNTIQELYGTQVAVDEATDFAPIQFAWRRYR
jgi:hypothetical protein